MPSSFTSSLGIEKPADGEQDGVWGDIVNANMEILDRTSDGQATLTLTGTSSSFTVTSTNGQKKVLILAGSPSGTYTLTLIPDTSPKIYFVRNTTAQSVVFTQGSGGNITVAAGDSGILYANGGGTGAAVFNLSDHFSMSSVNITGGTATLSSLVATTADINGGTIDGTTLGASTAAAATVTNLTASGTVNLTGATVSNGGSVTTVDINGGTIDATAIGATTPAAAAVTDLTASGAISLTAASGTISFAGATVSNGGSVTTVDINGGTIDGATVGATTAATGRFTSLASDSLTNTAGTRGPALTKGYVETVFALTGTTPALDPANGTVQTWTLTANSTPTDSVAAGESLTLMIDDGTSRTITWPSVVWKTGAGVAPTLNITGFTAIVLWKVGAVLYGARVGDA
jgi:hypothetical protein